MTRCTVLDDQRKVLALHCLKVNKRGEINSMAKLQVHFPHCIREYTPIGLPFFADDQRCWLVWALSNDQWNLFSIGWLKLFVCVKGYLREESSGQIPGQIKLFGTSTHLLYFYMHLQVYTPISHPFFVDDQGRGGLFERWPERKCCSPNGRLAIPRAKAFVQLL